MGEQGSFFQEASGNGVQTGFSLTSALSDYQGHEFVENNFEQYKIQNVEILMKPSASALEYADTVAGSIKYQSSIYSAMNQTYIRSFVDYDTDTNPTLEECEQRPNLKVRALAPNNWTKIASYSPRTLTNPSSSGGAPSNNFNRHWMSTNNMDVKLYGLRGIGTNPAPIFDTQDNVNAVDVRVTITVHMRGPKNFNGITSPAPILNMDNPEPEEK